MLTLRRTEVDGTSRAVAWTVRADAPKPATGCGRHPDEPLSPLHARTHNTRTVLSGTWDFFFCLFFCLFPGNIFFGFLFLFFFCFSQKRASSPSPPPRPRRENATHALSPPPCKRTRTFVARNSPRQCADVVAEPSRLFACHEPARWVHHARRRDAAVKVDRHRHTMREVMARRRRRGGSRQTAVSVLRHRAHVRPIDILPPSMPIHRRTS